MTEENHLLGSYDIDELIDEVASADPPAYLHRCLAEGIATAHLSRLRLQQLAGCALLVDAVATPHDYDFLEPELIADWRVHHAAQLRPLRPLAVRALQAARRDAPEVLDAAAIGELAELAQRLGGG